MDGSIASSKRRAMPAMEEVYCIRSLSAPMRLSTTGELCSRFYITQGTTLTIGRSKKSCDVVFDDTRVSRQHCQLRLLPHSNTLILLDGATTSGDGTEIYLDSHFPEIFQDADDNRLHSFPQMYIGALGDGPHSKELKCLPDDFRDIQNARKFRRKARMPPHRKEKRSRMDSPPSRASRHKPVKEESGPWKPSLNGVFVNGREFCARMMVLVPGDEVSLVGPTEGGKSLDSDCHAAIGFVVESRPMVEKAQPTIMQHTFAVNFSASGIGGVSHDVGDASCSPLDNMQDKQPELLSVKSSQCDLVAHNVNKHRCSMIAISIDGNQCTESDMQTGDSNTKRSNKTGSADRVEEGSFCSVSSLNVQAAQVNEASSPIDLDDKLLSTLELVKASMRLRSDLLKGYTAGRSGAVVDEKELPLTTAEMRVHPSREDSVHKMFLTCSTMPIVCVGPFENQKVGDHANEKEISFSLEHTIKIDSVPLPQAILPDNIVTRNLEGCGVPVLEEDASVSPVPASYSKQENCLTCSSLENHLVNDAGANSCQFTRPLLVPPISHTVIATDVLSQMLDAVLCETSPANYLVPSATIVTSLEGSVSGNLQTLTHQGVKDDTAEEAKTFYEHSHANGAGRLMVGAVTASLTMTHVNEELSVGQASAKVKIGTLHHSSYGCTVGGLKEVQALKEKTCRLEDGNQLDLLETGQIAVEPKATHQEVCCQWPPMPPMDVGTSECTLKGVGLSTSKSVDEVASIDKVQVKVTCVDMEGMQRQENCAVLELGSQELVCSLDRQQQSQSMCTLGLSRIDTEISVEKVQDYRKGSVVEDVKKEEAFVLQELEQKKTFINVDVTKHLLAGACRPNVAALGPCHYGLKEEGCCKEAALESTIEGKGYMGLEPSILEDTADKSQSLSTLQPDHTVVCKEPRCKDGRSNDGEEDKVEEVVGMVASQVQTSSGYHLNQLEDATPSASGIDDTVRLWDLLALTDDVQALFIATFTYDMEWFLSSAGLSRDIPVTVACHDAKHCWSRVPKDRCEKPFLDWPNVTLVYPPFPRNNAFGSKGQGIGCHHPKIFLVRRSASLRVVVSSANLTYKQWFHVTNNVWWQDFSCRQSPDFRSLFRGKKDPESSASPDFASQLAMFLAALLVDAPSEAHWVTELAAFDFSDATGSLVASVPGLHQPLYYNAPQFLMSLDKEACYPSLEEDAFASSYLGVVPTTVAGIKYRFCPSADRNGTRIRCLAAALNDTNAYEESTMPVLLKRAKFLKADPNAVSVVVTSRAKGCNQDLFLQQDLHDAEINTMETDTFDTEEGFIKLGFLPRDVASWLAVLCDQGFFAFAGCIWPTEALTVASGQRDGAVKLALYIFQGPKFSSLSPAVMTRKECGALSGLLKSLHNTWGLWRLEKVLCQYDWVDSCESDFYVASSSIGTSLDAKFLAAFAAAAGRRAESTTLSQESDPQWGCWTAEKEAANPSIGIVFPTIDRVRQDNFLHYGLLCFAESAWLRLKSARLLHDAVPFPPEREGFPMHIKVARRRFRDPLSCQSYGWMYCGSHNFSPAAWGRPIWRSTDWEAATDAGSVLGSSLHICNYELGVVLMEPPPHEGSSTSKKEPNKRGLDGFVLPFKVPPPMYRDNDRPATGRAMMEAYMEMKALQLKAAEEDVAVMQSEDPLEEAGPVQQEDGAACEAEREQARAEQVYAETLWTQIDDEDQRKKE